MPREVTDGDLRDGRLKKDSAGDEGFNDRGVDDVPDRNYISREVSDGESAAGKDVNDGSSVKEDETNTTGGSHPPDRDATPEQSLRQNYPKI